MTALTDKQLDAAKRAAKALDSAGRDLRVLSSLRWEVGMREAFLTRGVMPNPDYPSIDTSNAVVGAAL